MTQQAAPQAPQGNPADVFELNRAELQSVIDYLGSRPAAETFRLLAGLLSKPVARAAALIPEVEALDAPGTVPEERTVSQEAAV